ncbi:MAG: VCBS repeat-containing protein, partial [Chloroflexi bacterium]|nr:VCBS repeat-containing protein [Chloroflexota bacterium]
VADLDGDGDLDAVAANDRLIWVLLNEGGGTFSAPAGYESPEETRFLVVADVSGDGVPELIAANRSSATVSVFAGSGGAFTHEADFAAGDSPGAIAAGDFDLDGDLDLATVNRESLDFSILVNGGGGAFAPPVSYPIEGLRPSHVRAGDFNGDGFPDLAAGTARSYSELMNGGGGTFADAVNYSGLALGLDLGDFDGDGDLDLATGSQPNVLSVKVNDGSGRFGVSADFVAPNVPESIALGDFDGDGLLDAAVVTTSPSVLGLLWNGEGRAVAVATEIIPLPPGCQSDGGGCRPHSGTVADIDGDGDLDLIGANTHPGSFAVALNDGSGGMEIQPVHIFGGEHPQSVDTGDLDGDGDLDAVTVDNLEHDLWVHLGRGDATFLPPRKFPVAGDGAPINVKLADFDGDGDLDAASANQGRASISVL